MQVRSLWEDFQNLRAGDIFLASYPARSGRLGRGICLVLSCRAGAVEARTVTTQWPVTFDRTSLMGEYDGTPFTVTYAKPLPQDVQSGLLSLDRRFSAGDESKLTAEEKRALLFVAKLP